MPYTPSSRRLRVSAQKPKASIQSSVLSPQPYDTWQQRQVTLRGETYTYAAKPGVPGGLGVSVAQILLASETRIEAGERVLSVPCRQGVVGLSALRRGAGEVICLDSNIVAVEATQRTMSHEDTPSSIVGRTPPGRLRAPASVVRPSSATAAVTGEQFDVILVELPKGKALVNQLILDGFALLRPGGRFYLAGANDEGIQGYARTVAQVFGNVSTAGVKSGNRVVLASKRSDAIPAALLAQVERGYYTFRPLTFHIGEAQYTVITRPGIFSWDELDPATAMLLEQLPAYIQPQDHVLDLGCGYGILGLAASHLAPHGRVVLVDVEVPAVEATQRTMSNEQRATRCGVPQGTDNNDTPPSTVHRPSSIVLLSDGTRAVQNEQFDLILSNPPFHLKGETDYHVVAAFIEQAAHVLRPGGRLLLVANRFLAYEDLMQAALGRVTMLTQSKQFKLLLAER